MTRASVVWAKWSPLRLLVLLLLPPHHPSPRRDNRQVVTGKGHNMLVLTGYYRLKKPFRHTFRGGWLSPPGEPEELLREAVRLFTPELFTLSMGE